MKLLLVLAGAVLLAGLGEACVGQNSDPSADEAYYYDEESGEGTSGAASEEVESDADAMEEDEEPAADEPVDDCDPEGAGKMGTDSFECPVAIEDVKGRLPGWPVLVGGSGEWGCAGNTCCSEDLELVMLEAAGGTDLKASAETMREAVEAKFQGEWHCSIGQDDIGYAGYRVSPSAPFLSQDGRWVLLRSRTGTARSVRTASTPCAGSTTSGPPADLRDRGTR